MNILCDDPIYDVAILPGIRRPMAIGFQSEEIKHVVSFDQ